MINVVKPFLPPLEEYQQLVTGIWNRGWLTNNGPLVNELEIKLTEYLAVQNLFYIANGTIALQIAIKAIGLKGKIITTPFSYIATTSSIIWEGCDPVFADIDEETYNIDATQIEDLITEDTCAILATHVFGNPCDVFKLEAIAKKYNLKLIFDGAHAFGVKIAGRPIGEFGDAMTLSFHATKLFHTVEGGGIIVKNGTLAKQIGFLRNFGHDGPEQFSAVGINGKNSEFHAAMGLCVLKYIPEILDKRRELSQYYDLKLADLPLKKQKVYDTGGYNYSYYSILLPSEKHLLSVVRELNAMYVYPRRYFYPSLSDLSFVNRFETPVARNVSSRILCLPLYHTLTTEEIDLVVVAIKKGLMI